MNLNAAAASACTDFASLRTEGILMLISYAAFDRTDAPSNWQNSMFLVTRLLTSSESVLEAFFHL